MSTLASVVGRGTLASRPAASIAGRLYYATDGSGTLYRDNGSSWDSVETTVSGSATTVAAKAYNSTTQSIPNNADTVLTFDSEEKDTDAIHSMVSNTSRFTIPSGKDGYYLAKAQIFWASNTTGLRAMRFLKNGTAVRGGYVTINTPPAGATVYEVSWEGDLVATDYLEINVYQNSGGALNVGSTTNYEQCAMSVSRLGT